MEKVYCCFLQQKKVNSFSKLIVIMLTKIRSTKSLTRKFVCMLNTIYLGHLLLLFLSSISALKLLHSSVSLQIKKNIIIHIQTKTLNKSLDMVRATLRSWAPVFLISAMVYYKNRAKLQSKHQNKMFSKLKYFLMTTNSWTSFQTIYKSNIHYVKCNVNKYISSNDLLTAWKLLRKKMLK